LRKTVHGRVVAGFETYQQVGVFGYGQILERVRQIRRTDLGGSPAGTRHAQQFFFLKKKH
jgi:hypothetical protein